MKWKDLSGPVRNYIDTESYTYDITECSNRVVGTVRRLLNVYMNKPVKCHVYHSSTDRQETKPTQ